MNSFHKTKFVRFSSLFLFHCFDKWASVTFIAKVEGVIWKSFLGGDAPNPLSFSPIHILTAKCDCYVHPISRLSFYNSIQFYSPPPSYATILVGKKVSPTPARKLLGTELHTKTYCCSLTQIWRSVQYRGMN